jgi:tryptophan-rich sensory protein
MSLARPIVWLLVVVWLVAFGWFTVLSVLAYATGNTFEYKLFGVQFPFVAFALLACMAASSGLLWFNYRGVDFSGAEETIYGALFGVSVFGLMLSLILVLMA